MLPRLAPKWRQLAQTLAKTSRFWRISAPERPASAGGSRGVIGVERRSEARVRRCVLPPSVAERPGVLARRGRHGSRAGTPSAGARRSGSGPVAAPPPHRARSTASGRGWRRARHRPPAARPAGEEVRARQPPGARIAGRAGHGSVAVPGARAYQGGPKEASPALGMASAGSRGADIRRHVAGRHTLSIPGFCSQSAYSFRPHRGGVLTRLGPARTRHRRRLGHERFSSSSSSSVGRSRSGASRWFDKQCCATGRSIRSLIR